MSESLLEVAQAISSKPLNLQQTSATIYPPLPLYRRLLRAHRRLPIEMRTFGDAYVKDEFRRHREVTNPVLVMGFLTQWKMYLDELPHDPSAKNFKKLDPTVFEKMSDEQLGQLHELMHASKGVWKAVNEDGFDPEHGKS
ncbi:ACN9-domain-containing protein [Imleria badia]|nr:ACN9-domain-containing protein [Imleria badia]